MFCFHPSSWISITITACRSIIQNMGAKMHPGVNEKWTLCFQLLKRPQLKSIMFHVPPVMSPYFLETTACINPVRFLNGSYARFVHVPNVAWPKLQTIKHLFQIVKKCIYISLVKARCSSDACRLGFEQRKAFVSFKDLCKPFCACCFQITPIFRNLLIKVIAYSKENFKTSLVDRPL
jgi:hypothetical protein